MDKEKRNTLIGLTITIILLVGGVLVGWHFAQDFLPQNANGEKKSTDIAALAAEPNAPINTNKVKIANAVSTTSITNVNELTAILQTSDNLVAQKNYARADELLSKNLLPDNNPLNAGIFYRLGIVNRYAQNEEQAQKYWQTGYHDYPLTPAGRLCAVALADTWYAWYASKENADYAQWEKIRNAYSDAIGMDGARFLDQATTDRLAERLNELNEYLVFSPNGKVRGAIYHTIQNGEKLTDVARKYNLDSWRSLVDINKINPATLQAGMKIKILPGRVFILINKRDFTLSWYLDGIFIRRYRCATGAVETETPPGRYEICKIEANPDWRDPKTGKTYKFGEPGHLIGSRWMAMRGEGTNGLGIHGTTNPESMGKKASNGCIRLLKKDVEELYGFVSVQNGNQSEILVIE